MGVRSVHADSGYHDDGIRDGIGEADFMRAQLLIASSMSLRLRGLLLTKPGNIVLLLVPCKDVHTFGMRYAIDIAFLASDGCVLEVHRDVLPRQRRRCKKAAATIERFAAPNKQWFRQGDYMDVAIATRQ